MTDEDIINYLWPKKISLLKRYKVNDDIIEYLKNRYNDSESIEESLYRLKYNIEEKPRCPVCDKKLSFDIKKNKFKRWCDYSCMNKDKNKKEKTKQHFIDIYGVENPSQLEDVKNKVKNTSLLKYGVENPSQYKDTREKISTSHLSHNEDQKKIINEKRKKTTLDIYNVENVAQLDSSKDKSKNTSLNKYGYDHWAKSNEGRKQMSKIVSSYEVQLKTIETKKMNGSYLKSKPEDETYLYIKERYPDVKRQYMSDEYPYYCDFYIPSFSLYIECNYHWTHGRHPYNSNDKYDINKVNEWKSKNTKFYNNAIETWTRRDVKKREIGKQLNWIEFFNIKELKEWLEKH